MNKTELKLSKIASIALILWAATATIFAVVSAQTNFTVRTPFIADLLAGPGNLTVDSISFYYDVELNTYPNASVVVRNADTPNTHSGTVYIYLYETGGAEIASGSVVTGDITGVTAMVVVDLAWVSGYTVSDFDRGKLVITQTS